ncbi:MAG: mRNA-degrading endonuclease [Chloroflexi bacterium]|nr:MAG: mRNA-degrading endonuclease [Phototrophicales bacterium]RMF80758.1 MAG: mRNA-degrading endonuclease [Chloroflexota bacterium]
MAYTPARGDVVWVNLNPRTGHEQAGRRPVVILTPQDYNQKVGLAIVCPITSQDKNYPFDVHIPDGLDVHGVVLSNHVHSIDWQARQVEFITRLPDEILDDIRENIYALLD